MIKSGIWMNIISIIFLTAMVYYLLPVVWNFDASNFAAFMQLEK